MAKDRIVAVFGAEQGSGYLLSPRHLLTAGHLAAAGTPLTAAVPGGTGRIACEPIWVGRPEEGDVALLLADEDLVGPELAAAFTPVRFGYVDGLAPVLDCYAVGFPHAQQYGGGLLDTEQLVGTIKPGTQLVRGDYVIDSAHTPPAAPPDGTSPWAGMTGAPLFSGQHLIGVVTGHPEGWRHGRLTAVPLRRLFSHAHFVNVYRSHFGAAFRFTALRHVPDTSDEFEQRYRDYVADTYGELNVFGLDFRRAEHAQWPLDLAYISLELVRHHSAEPDGSLFGTEHRTHRADERSRVEYALHGHKRVLLRGLAGSGKTTLVQWLAVNAARDSFDGQLADLGGRIPVVLPMRTLVRGAALPAVGDFLSAAGHPLAPPAGWLDGVLTEGRGLLLVDGVDEIAERNRARTREWLYRLLGAYPHNVVVVTTRPTAVDDGWLDRKGFTELQLLPMNQRDVGEFVRRWHQAAASICPNATEQAKLDTYRDQLLATLPRKRDLGRLATNPLMCAMICALHRDRRGFLPDSRMKLYGAALTMLLVRRDQEREVAAPEGLEVSEEAQQKLLQEIAYWMIRNGLAEAEQKQVIALIARLLPAMPQVATPDQAPLVFRFLLHRSGLLRTPTSQTVDFVHRTFLDYLGSRAAVDAQDFNLVATHAHDPQWEDVVRMAVGHARDSERALLLRKLIELGDASELLPPKTRLHLLAAASLEHATSLDPKVRSEVAWRTRMLIPPRSTESAQVLAEAGPLVLELLPDLEGLTEEEAAAVVDVAGQVGGAHAFQILLGYRNHPSPQVRSALVHWWSNFDPRQYAEQVLAEMRTDDLRVTVKSADELAMLPLIGPLHDVTFSGSLSPASIGTNARAVKATGISIIDNPQLTSLTPVAESASQITLLRIRSCSQQIDYSSLSALGLRRLELDNVDYSSTLGVLRSVSTLQHLEIDVRLPLGTPIPLPPDLRELSLWRRVATLEGIDVCQRLKALEIPPAVPPSELGRLANLSELRRLTLLCNLNQLKSRALPPLTAVERLYLDAQVVEDTDASELRRLFPRLDQLYARLRAKSSVTVDVTALTRISVLNLNTDGPITLVRDGRMLPPRTGVSATWPFWRPSSRRMPGGSSNP